MKSYENVVAVLRDALPTLLAVYAFGSRVRGTANADSDLDLAVLVEGYADPLQLFALAGKLADQLGYEVDVLDLRAASTVMQAQVLQGERLWTKDAAAGIFEAMVLSEKMALDEDVEGGESDMSDDVLRNKAEIIQFCVARAREEYAASADFVRDFTRQDAAIFNVQRACEAAIDMGKYLVRRDQLGVPQSTRDVFTLLASAGWITDELADGLKRMVGFRNIAVHQYQALVLPVVVAVITHELDDCLRFSQQVLRKDAENR